MRIFNRTPSGDVTCSSWSSAFHTNEKQHVLRPDEQKNLINKFLLPASAESQYESACRRVYRIETSDDKPIELEFGGFLSDPCFVAPNPPGYAMI